MNTTFERVFNLYIFVFRSQTNGYQKTWYNNQKLASFFFEKFKLIFTQKTANSKWKIERIIPRAQDQIMNL